MPESASPSKSGIKQKKKQPFPFLKLFVILFFIETVVFWISQNFFLFGDPVYIAVSAPTTGNRAANAKAIIDGVQLRVDEVNQAGGIHGRKVKILLHDDNNKTEYAPRIVTKIAHSQAVAAIGHYSNNVSLAAANIYKQHKIPVITGSATINGLTQDNPWYFRTIFNDADQTGLLANYANKVLGYEVAHIIYDEDEVGRGLATGFSQVAAEIGLDVQQKWHYKSDRSNFHQVVADMHDYLKSRGKDARKEIVFMAVHSTQALELIMALRHLEQRIPLLGRTSLAGSNFLQGLQQTPQERAQPGYFSDGIYLTSPYLPALANNKGQIFNKNFIQRFGEIPEATAALHYDAVSILIDTLQKLPQETLKLSIETQRDKLRHALWKIASPQEAFIGVSGQIYFESNGDTIKSIPAGVFRKGKPSMALEQFELIHNPKQGPDLLARALDKEVILMNGKLMRRIDVIYSGININEIGAFDEKTLTCEIDFYLWFRYRGKMTPDKIKFLYSVNEIDIGKPIHSQHLAESNETYHLHRVKAKFKARFKPDYVIRKQYLLDLSFKQLDFGVNELIMVADISGMGLDNKESLAEKLYQDKVINPHDGWVVRDAWYDQRVAQHDYTRFASDIKNTEAGAGQSQFGLIVQIKADEFSIRGNMSSQWTAITFNLSLCLLLFYSLHRNDTKHVELTQMLWLPFSLLYYTLLISAEPLLVDWLIKYYPQTNMAMVVTFFDITWWLVSAILLITFLENFIWQPAEKKTGRVIPKLIRHVTKFVIYLLSTFGVIAFVYGQTLTGLLATSGMFAMVIGLAIKMNIADVVSGVVVSIERPFRIGDWVKIDDMPVSKVLDMTWRSTRLISGNVITSIPNSSVSSSKIINYNYPDNFFWQSFEVDISPVYNPDTIKKVIYDAVLSHVPVHKAKVIFSRLEAGVAIYSVRFYLSDFEARTKDNEVILEKVWVQLYRINVKPYTPQQSIQLLRNEADDYQIKHDVDMRNPRKLLDKIQIINGFSDEAKQALSTHMHKKQAVTGDEITRKGDPSTSLFIVADGVVESVGGQAGQTHITRRTMGDFFGDPNISRRLFTVTALSDVCLYEIDNSILLTLLAEHKEVALELKQYLAEKNKTEDLADDKWYAAEADDERNND